MAKPIAAIDSDDTVSYNAVFVDTSIGTRLATVVSNSDTVAELKQKIMHEHPVCFPRFGKLKIHALKVKRKGCFYHLSESMLVKSAFHGVNKSWFISVDASIVKENDDNGHFSFAHIPDYDNMVACITTPSNGSAEEYNSSHNKPEKLSGIDDGHPNLKVPIAGQLCLDVADRDFAENLEMRAEHTGDDHNNVKSLDEKKDSDPNMQEKDNDKKENQKTQTDGSSTSKKRKNRKRKKLVHDLAVKETVASLPESDKHESLQEILVRESSLQNAHQVASHDNVTRKENITDMQGMVSCSDANKGTGPPVQRAAILSEGTGVLVEDASQSEPAAKKKRKIEDESKGGENIPNDETLTENSHKEVLESPTIAKHSVVDRQTIVNATLDGSSNGNPKAVHLQSVGPKHKTKKKSSNTLNQESSAVTSSKTNVTDKSPADPNFNQESSAVPSPKTNVTDKSPADPNVSVEEVVVPGKHDQGVIGSEPGAESLKEKHGDPVQDINKRCSSHEFDINKADTGNVESGHNASGSAIASDAKSMRVPQDHQAVNVKGFPHLEVHESDEREKETVASQHENMILNDNQSHVADETDRIEEERESTLNFTLKSAPSEKYKASDQDELELKTSATAYPAKSSKKRKKSKRKNALASATPFTSITEHIEGFLSGLSPTEPIKVAKGDHSGDNVNKNENNISPRKGMDVSEIDTMSTLVADKEIDDVVKNAVESVQQISKGQVDAENIGVKSRKKTKKKRSADAKNIPESKKLESNSEERHLEAVLNCNPSKSEGSDDTEISCENKRIYFNDYFAPRQHSCEASIDRTIEVNRVDAEMKARKNKKKHEAQRLDENHEVGAKPQAGNSKTGEFHGSISSEEPEKVMLQPSKDSLKVSEHGVKAPQSSKSDKLNSVPEEARRSNAVKPSGTSSPAKSKRTKSNASLANSENTVLSRKRVTRSQSLKNQNHMDGRKTSAVSSGDVVDHSQHGKSLIGLPGSIFEDDNDAASSNEDDNSDTSTRTPSDKSFSSDYSDGESNADFDSLQNDSRKRKEGSGKTLSKPLSADMTMDMIFRSSSRYKKAKLTASQSQLEDAESQPVDFVPDSQAN